MIIDTAENHFCHIMTLESRVDVAIKSYVLVRGN